MNSQVMIDRPEDLGWISLALLTQFPVLIAINILIAKIFKLKYQEGATSVIIASSSNFEIAIAVAVSLRGSSSQAALGTTMGLFW